MARSKDEIIVDIKQAIVDTDKSYDVEQGPIPDIFIRPIAGPIGDAEASAEDLRKLFSLQFAETATDEEIKAALNNYASSPGEGTKAQHTQYFMRFSKPIQDITIPVGALISNSNSNYVYRTLDTITMSASSPDVFYNPSRGCYEVGVLTEATGTGTEYELPPYRINTMLTAINGIDATENRSTPINGFPVETTSSQSDRLRKSLLGLNSNSPGGIMKKVTDVFTGRVTDVSVIKTSDSEFYRIVDGPAMDIYIIGKELETYKQSFNAVQGQTTIMLDMQPVESISSVTVNGSTTSVEWELIKDQSKEYKESLGSNDYILIKYPQSGLLLSDSVEVEYTYNKLLHDVDSMAINYGDEVLFNTNYLLRYPVVINPNIEIELKVLPSYNFDEVANSIRSYWEGIFNFVTFTKVINPNTLRDDTRNKISGIQMLRFNKFRKSVGGLSDVEPMIFASNEISEYNPNLVIIKSVT